MKVVIFSDIHHNISGHTTRQDGKNDRLMDSISVQDQIFDYVIDDYSIKEIWFLGDLFERKDKLPIPVVQECVKSFSRFFKEMERQKRTIPIRLLIGNHDRYKPSGKFKEYITLSHLSGFSGIAIIDEVFIQHYKEVNVKIAWIPWEKSIEDFQNCIDYAEQQMKEFNGKKILLIHQGILGGVIGNDNIMIEEEITTDTIKSNFFDLILSGHYHKKQIVYSKGKGNVMFVGSPLQLDWSESKEKDKGFLVLDLNDLTYKSIKTSYPEYFIVDANSIEVLFYAENMIKDGKVRREMLKVFTEDQEVVEAMPKGLLYKYSPKPQVAEPSHITYDIVKDNQKLIDKYLRSIPNDLMRGLDRRKLLEIGMDALQKVGS